MTYLADPTAVLIKIHTAKVHGKHDVTVESKQTFMAVSQTDQFEWAS